MVAVTSQNQSSNFVMTLYFLKAKISTKYGRGLLAKNPYYDLFLIFEKCVQSKKCK